MDERKKVGEIIKKKNMKKVGEYVDKERKEGEEIENGGEVMDIGIGKYMGKKIMEGVKEDMEVESEEVLGKVM